TAWTWSVCGYCSRSGQANSPTPPLPQRLEQMSPHPGRDLREFFLCKLEEMRCGAVGFERGVVFVLLVDEESARLRLVPVGYVHCAARFFARCFRQLGEDSDYVILVPHFRHPRHRQDNHCTLPCKQLSAVRSQLSVNSLKAES